MNRAIRRRLFGSVTLAGAVAGVLAACTTAQQAQATSTTVQVVAWLQQSETALETLITISVPQASQAAAEAALQEFSTAATAVGSAISNALPATTVAQGVQSAVAVYNQVVAVVGPMLPPNAQAILAGATIAIGLLTSYYTSVLTPNAPLPPPPTAMIAKRLTTIVPSK
jgi:cytoskeletal protein RodZ